METYLHLSAPWWTFVVRGVATYFGLLILMRLAGKRSFGEMSAFDVIVLVLVGGTLRTAIIGDDQGFAGPFIGVASILACDKALAWSCSRSAMVNRLFEGRPAILVRDGQRDREALRKENVPEAALDRALHGAGREDEHGIAIGRLEPNGRISLIPKDG
jgi:uncharacterized membrane protein YcaP (DUF421 family)